MARVTIDQIKMMIIEHEQKQLAPKVDREDGFLEIIFKKKGVNSNVVDSEYQNVVLSVDCIYGSVLIIFDKDGLLSSIEIC